jgi:predicted secreted hydrolase
MRNGWVRSQNGRRNQNCWYNEEIMKRRPIKLPEDMLPHDTVIEWWYFNGHLADASENRYAFMDCLFRADVKKVNIPYLKNFVGRSKSARYAAFAHSVLVDIAKKESQKEVQNISLVSRDSFTRPLFFVNYIDPVSAVNGFVANEIAEMKPGTFHVKTKWADLTMVSKKKPLLEGGEGFIAVRGRESFYYSLTKLKTTGSVRVGGQWIPVEGTSWMDHQWSDVSYAKDRWTWFSVQLDDGTDLMCVEYDDGKGKDFLVDVRHARGHSVHYRHALFSPGERTWKSKTTNAAYPLDWTITVPEGSIELKISAILPDEEMIFGSINYWEGPVAVAGTIGRKKAKGVGFMELAGYPSKYNFLILAGKKLNKEITQRLGAKVKNFFG